MCVRLIIGREGASEKDTRKPIRSREKRQEQIWYV